MSKRIITAVVALALFIPVLYFSNTLLFPIVVALLSAVALCEVLKCLKVLSKPVISIPAVLFALALPILARVSVNTVLPIFIMALVYIIFCSISMFGSVDITIVSTVVLQFIIVVGGFTALVLNRDMEPTKYLLIFVIAWMTDTFAIFGGMLFGKHKLCPQISPKKTVQGAFAGVFGAFLGTGLFTNIVPVFTYKTMWLLFAMYLSIIGQLGDLVASALKRHFGIKDYGNIFPGHGGVLDRFDSILPISLVMLAINLFL